jgi:hypothetical protein
MDSERVAFIICPAESIAMFQLIKSEVKPLTPELAREFHELTPSPTEREINPARIKMLREKAALGHLVTFHWSAATLKGKRMRMNGQHSSTMLSELNGSFPEGLKVHLDDYSVEDEGDLAMLFRQFDERKSSRSAADVSGAYQGLITELHDVPRLSAKLAVDGLAWYQRTVSREPTPKGDDIYSLFGQATLHPFIKWISEVFSIKTPEMKSTPIVAAMYASFMANESEAKRFWHQVAMGGVEFEDNAPATVLDAWLKSIKEGEIKKKLTPAEIYQGCVYAWNAYRQERSITGIKSDTRHSWLTVSE